MDEFKKYLIENQDQFNADEPSPLVWSKVQQSVKLEKSTTTGKVFSMRKLVQWSAAACILGLAGIGVWYLLNHQSVVIKPVQEQVTINNESSPMPSPTNNTKVESPTVSTPEDAKASAKSTPTPNSRFAKATNPSAQSFNKANNVENTMTALANMESGFIQIINLQKGKISTTPMYAESASYFNEFKAQINQLEQDENQIKKDIAKKGLTDHQLDQLINLYQYKLTVLKQLQLEMNKTNNRYKQNRGPVDSTRTYFINI
ncbi:hypothetical protein [Sediminibacterium sp.]|uniref:hypothetical protein n=1 Tax=Sediminibacterium sp. TaxID=1917865 RepID=UPI003F7027BB